jgi:hypothetical protein
MVGSNCLATTVPHPKSSALRRRDDAWGRANHMHAHPSIPPSHATCYMRHATCYMLPVTCYLLPLPSLTTPSTSPVPGRRMRQTEPPTHHSLILPQCLSPSPSTTLQAPQQQPTLPLPLESTSSCAPPARFPLLQLIHPQASTQNKALRPAAPRCLPPGRLPAHRVD